MTNRQCHVLCCLPRRRDIEPAETEVGVHSPAELRLVDEELAHNGALVSPLEWPHVPDH